MQIPKIVKIIISILIAISIAVNPFCGVFNVMASAVDPILTYAAGQALYDFFIMLVTGTGSAVIGGLLQDIDSQLQLNASTHYEEIIAPIEQGGNPLVFASRYSDAERQRLIDNGSLLDYQYPAVVSVDESYTLTDEQREFYESFCEAFNEANVIAEENFTTGYVPTVSASDYSTIKNKVANAFYSQLLTESLGNDSVPLYSFDFVGPQPYMTIPTFSTATGTSKNGFVFGQPISSNSLTPSGYISSEDMAYSMVAGLYDVNDSNSVRISDTGDGYNIDYTNYAFASGSYVVYNGSIYYNPHASGFGLWQRPENYGSITEKLYWSKHCWKTVDGVSLSDAGFDVSTNSYLFGLYVNATGEIQSVIPDTAEITEEDFTGTTGGGTVEIPRSDDEQTIGNALEMGLLTDDSMLTIGEDGTITAADGIDLATIESLLEKIANGQLEFDDIQQYLDLITQLIGAGNLTESEQKILLGNIEKLTQAQAKDISEIKDLIKSMTAEAEKEIVIDSELELEAPDVTIIDRFPFCLPFDLYRILALLCAEPKEPVFEIPINVTIGTGGLDYEIDEKIVLDLTIFRLHGYDMVRIFANSTSILFFVICLIAGTKKFIWK